MTNAVLWRYGTVRGQMSTLRILNFRPVTVADVIFCLAGK